MENSEDLVVLSGDKTSREDLRVIKNQIIGDPDIKLAYLQHDLIKSLYGLILSLQKTKCEVIKS